MLTRCYSIQTFILTVNLFLGSHLAQSQLSVGSTTLFVKEATTLSVDSLVLQTSADLALSNLNITHTATPITANSGNSINRVYVFSQAIPFTGNIGFYYKDGELNGNTEATLAFVYQRADDNRYITTTGSAIDAGNNYISQSLTALPIIKVTATNNNVSLPILLRSFNAKAAIDKVKLDWETTMEQGIDRFDVERSTDGVSFSLLTSIKGANSSTGYQYTTYDYHPAPVRNYYRLLQYDLNGHKAYYGIRSVIIDNNTTLEVIAYPNPATQVLNLRIQGNGQEKLQVALLTLQGGLLYSEDIQIQPGLDTYPIHIKQMPAQGNYLLKVTGNKGFTQVLQINIQ